MKPPPPLAAVTDPNPYPYYAALAVQRPFYRDDQQGFWVASSATAVSAILTHPAFRVRPPREPVPAALADNDVGAVFSRLIRMNDGALHRETKPRVIGALDRFESDKVRELSTRLTYKALAGTTGSLTGAQLDRLIFDLPVQIVGALLGVPDRLHPALALTVGDFVGALTPTATKEQIQRGVTAVQDLLCQFRTLPISPAQETDFEITLANTIGLLSQAYEATAGLIANTILAAFRQPDSWRESDSEEGLSQFIQEALRHDPPVQNTRRWAATDLSFEGQTIRAGEMVLVLLAAANHDAQVNPKPKDFRLDRPDRKIFTFGTAAHACPGQAITVALTGAVVKSLWPHLSESVIVSRALGYRPSANMRIPKFAACEEVAQ